MKRKIFLTIFIGIVLINLPIFDFYTKEAFSYTNSDGSFNYTEESGAGDSYTLGQRKYGHFLCQHPDKDQGDNRLYRTFTIKPWYFWEWRQFIFHSERFGLPYKDPAEIKKN